MRLGMTVLNTSPICFMTGPNVRSGSLAKVSALRPIRYTPRVKTAVRNGEENEANSMATAVTMETSQTLKIPWRTITRVSAT